MAELSVPTRIATGADVSDASLALLVVDDECVCVEASFGACRLLGISRRELLGRRLDEFIADEARDAFHHVWLAFKSDGGHAGPFLLDVRIPVAVSISVTADVVPSRHLLVLSPETADDRAGNGLTPAQKAAVDRTPPPANRRRGPTSREREVLRLLATGATDGQIASLLELSPATVQTHVRNAKAKLGARTRAQAVALALQRGMIRTG